MLFCLSVSFLLRIASQPQPLSKVSRDPEKMYNGKILLEWHPTVFRFDAEIRSVGSWEKEKLAVDQVN